MEGRMKRCDECGRALPPGMVRHAPCPPYATRRVLSLCPVCARRAKLRVGRREPRGE